MPITKMMMLPRRDDLDLIELLDVDMIASLEGFRNEPVKFAPSLIGFN